MNREKSFEPPKFGDPTEEDLLGMREYAEMELEGDVDTISHVKNFDYSFDDDEITVQVYEIKLKSGKKVFGCYGGWPSPMRNYYKGFSEPEKASHMHMYTTVKSTGLYAENELKKLADSLEIPEDRR